MHESKLILWARRFYILGIVCGILFIIPTVWFPLQLGKIALVAVCMLIASTLFALGGGLRNLFNRENKFALLVLTLPIVYALSWWFSVDHSLGFSGYAVEADTVLFILLCAIVFILSALLFRTTASAQKLLVGVAASAGIVALFQCIVVFFGGAVIPLQIFSDRSVNLVGKWNDLGLLVGLLFLLSVLWIQYGGGTRSRRIIALCFSLALLLLLAVIQFPLVWFLLGGFFLLLALVSFLSTRTVAWIPLACAGVMIPFILWGSSINAGLTKMLPISSLEVRPSFSSTLAVAEQSHGTSPERFLLGTGPQTFGEEWLLNKPLAVNQSPFWNLDFAVGFSTLITAFATVGILGVLAWLLPLILILFYFVRSMRAVPLSQILQKEQMLTWCVGFCSVYLWLATLFYVPSENLLLLAFALSGAALGFMAGHNRLGEKTAPTKLSRILFVVLSIILILIAVGVAGALVRRALAESYTNQGSYALAQNDADTALLLSARAQQIEKTGDALRLGVDAGALKIQQLAGATNAPKEQIQSEFTQLVGKIIPFGQQAIKNNPQDYRAYLSLGKVYDLLASLGVGGAYENAKAAYQSAAHTNPKNPQIPLLLARLDAAHGDVAATEQDITQSLSLKADYTDAILFVVQLYVAQKDIPNAIAAASAAVQSAPNAPAVLFELGLLYYSTGDTANAIPPLERAVAIQPDYANAKYFLGLSYAAQGRTKEGLAQFDDLAKTNPDNAEVALIRANLQVGKPPFTGAQPPITPKPQNRETAPIPQ